MVHTVILPCFFSVQISVQRSKLLHTCNFTLVGHNRHRICRATKLTSGQPGHEVRLSDASLCVKMLMKSLLKKQQ